jgi:EAL domain-containing protein (putative c-di-GMP-specific phosphodiesterase class I)
MARGRLNWTADSIPQGSLPPEGVRSLADAEIGVAFQPIVDVRTGLLFAHEALVRCTREPYKSPTVLFEHAVKEGACGRLGRKIREVAFTAAGDVALFINVHPEELVARWLVRPDDPIGFHKRPVYLEITESATLSYFEVCMSVLEELRGRTNARLVVDDFGAGYSNIERLIQLAPAVVKLDLALIRDIHRERRKQIVTRHMVNLCKDLGAAVVGEGVETLDELKCIRDLGVDYAQGYLLARPANPPPGHAWPLTREVGASVVSSRKGLPPLPRTETPPPRAPRTSLPADPASRRAPLARASIGPVARKSKPPERNR